MYDIDGNGSIDFNELKRFVPSNISSILREVLKKSFSAPENLRKLNIGLKKISRQEMRAIFSLGVRLESSHL